MLTCKLSSAHICCQLTVVRLEAFLTLRGQEYLATINQGASVIPIGGTEGATAAEVRQQFAPGSGMEHDDSFTGIGNALNGKGTTKRGN
jgi:hypothetical protein